jgi:hypothetical protein
MRHRFWMGMSIAAAAGVGTGWALWGRTDAECFLVRMVSANARGNPWGFVVERERIIRKGEREICPIRWPRPGEGALVLVRDSLPAGVSVRLSEPR